MSDAKTVKVTTLRTVLIPREGSKECDEVHAGEDITVPAPVAERFIRIGAAEKA